MAKLGDAEAQYNVGICYGKGIGVDKNEQKAFDWYLKAAKQGNTRAQTILGAVHVATHDYSEAIKWFKKAANQGSVEAQEFLKEIDSKK